MTPFPTYSAICSRAKAVGLSVSELCRRAQVPRSTFEGWKDKYDPNIDGYRRIIAALEGAELTAAPPEGQPS